MGVNEPKHELTELQLIKLSNESLVGKPAIRRAYQGLPIKGVTRARLDQAAAKLDYPKPPLRVVP